MQFQTKTIIGAAEILLTAGFGYWRTNDFEHGMTWSLFRHLCCG
jgi:hypothetical protein